MPHHAPWPVLALVVLGCGGVPSWWPSASPRTVAVADSDDPAFEATLTLLRLSGYEVDEYDARRLFIRVQSRIDGDVVARSVPLGVQRSATAEARRSFVTLQFRPGGTMFVRVDGYHVRDGRVDPRVSDELDAIIEGVVEEIARCSVSARPVIPP
jgi:hypothetical protein